MASAYGNIVQHWRARVDANIISTTDSQCTVRVETRWCAISWGYQVSNSYAQAICNGVGTGEIKFTAYSPSPSGSVETFVTSIDQTYNRSTSNQYITCQAICRLAGGYHNGTSTASTTVTIPALASVAPGTPTNVEATYVSDDKIDITWNLSYPSTGGISSNTIQVAIDNGDFTTVSSLGGSVNSYSYTAGEANHCYQFRVQSSNSSGASGWNSSNIIYTTPAAPEGGLAVQVDNTVACTVFHSNIKYPGSFDWQRSSNNSSWEDIDDTSASIVDTTSIDKPYYRVRCYGMGDIYSSWSPSFRANKIPRVFINMPSTTTEIQNVWFKVPDGTNSKDISIKLNI